MTPEPRPGDGPPPARTGASPARDGPPPPGTGASPAPGESSPAGASPATGASPPAGTSRPPRGLASRGAGGAFSPRVLLAIVIVAALGWITLNSLRTSGPSSRGLAAGAALPPFAAPLSSSSCRGACDANVATHADQGQAGKRPACAVRGAGILNSCELAARGPLVLAFLFTPVTDCRTQLDVLDTVRARHPEVSFAAVAVRADAAAARSLARYVKVPVAYDHDGAVANEYGVVVCPTITFATRGGRVAGSTVGPLDEAAIERWLARIS